MRPGILAFIAPLLFALPAYAEDVSLCKQGYKAKQSSDYKLAAKLYSLCIQHGKLRTKALTQAHYHRGDALMRLGKLKPALRDFSLAISKKGDLTAAYVGRAFIYSQTGKHVLAIEEYGRALRQKPNDAKLYYNRALSYIASKDYQRALRDLDKVETLNANFIGAINYNRGIIFAGLRLYDKATLAFDQWIQRSWQLSVAYFQQGQQFLRSKRYSSALATLNHAITLQPNYGDAYTYRGLAREKLGNKARAIKDYRAALVYGTTVPWVRKRFQQLRGKQ